MKPAIQTLPLLTLASGDALKLQMYRFQGAEPGLTVYCQANLHGAELAGNAVIQQLLAFLQACDPALLAGEVRLVPVCNPLGVNLRSHHFASGRYNPYDGRDWNRIFWDYSDQQGTIAAFAQAHHDQDLPTLTRRFREQLLTAFQRELEGLDAGPGAPIHERYRCRLQALALDADILLDLHSSSDRGLVYVYYFQNREDRAATFGLDFALLSDRHDGNAFDEAFIKPWLALEAELAQLGRPVRFGVDAWTVELGSAMTLEAIAVQRGLSGILNYLRHRGVLRDQPPIQVGTSRYARTSRLVKYHAPVGGFVQRRVALGTWVQRGDHLYDLLCFNKGGQLPTVRSMAAHQPGWVYDISTSEAVNEGEYVLAMTEPVDPPLPTYGEG